MLRQHHPGCERSKGNLVPKERQWAHCREKSADSRSVITSAVSSVVCRGLSAADTGTVVLHSAACCLSVCWLLRLCVYPQASCFSQHYCVAANSSARQPALTLSVLSVDFNVEVFWGPRKKYYFFSQEFNVFEQIIISYLLTECL